MVHQKQHTVTQQNIVTINTLESLICALLALTPNEYLFKRLNVKTDIYKYKTSIITNGETIAELDKLLKKPAVKVLATSLLGKIRYDKIQLSTKNGDFSLQEAVLKKYLQKFYYLYLRYFLIRTKTHKNAPPIKEINILAIRALILIAGV